MTVLVENVATELARPTPSGAQANQWESWIARAYRMIQDRFGEAYASLNQAVVDDVVLVSVAEHVRAWRDSTASQYTVSVDDGSTTRRYEASAGPFGIPDSLWALLEVESPGGAFSIGPA